MLMCVCVGVCVRQGDTLEMIGDPLSGMARCPYDPKHANVALFAGKDHYACPYPLLDVTLL